MSVESDEIRTPNQFRWFTLLSLHLLRFKNEKPKHRTRAEIRKRFGKDIQSVEEAKECIKLLSAKFETEKIRIQRRLTWETEFYSFANLLEGYVKKQKKRALNSWQNNVFYLKHYVLYFFLQDQRLNLIDLWADHFEKLCDWLEAAKRFRGKGQEEAVLQLVQHFPDRQNLTLLILASFQ